MKRIGSEFRENWVKNVNFNPFYTKNTLIFFKLDVTNENLKHVMKKLFAIALYAGFLVLVANCAPNIGKIVTSQPLPSKLEVQQEYTAEQLQEGRKIWKSTCDRCHKLYPEDKHTAEGWNKTLKRMIHRSKMTEEEGLLVRAYLVSKSKD